MKKKILYFDNCWFTNVGEAFIDLGAMKMIHDIFGSSEIILANATDMTEWYIEKNRHYKSLAGNAVKHLFKHYFKNHTLSKAQNLFELYKPDYFILCGMFACEEFLKSPASELIEGMSANGTEIIFLGLGGLHYNQSEIDKFTNYIKRIKPLLIVTRDDQTYENYRNAASCIKGIDCAFWNKDIYDPRGMASVEYDVVAFNRSEEPAIYQSDKWKYPIIRPEHFQYDFSLRHVKKNTMISDSPYDYLTLYANAHRVYTDLVHATVTSLQYGVPVQFYPVDQRKHLFEALHGLKSVEGFLTLDSSALEEQKFEIIEMIRRGLLIKNGSDTGE